MVDKISFPHGNDGQIAALRGARSIVRVLRHPLEFTMEEVPFEDRVVPKAEIDWERSAWWWIPLTRSVHPAIKLSSLVGSLIAVGLAQAGVRFAGLLFQPELSNSARNSVTNSSNLIGSPIVDWFTTLISTVMALELNWNGLAVSLPD